MVRAAIDLAVIAHLVDASSESATIAASAEIALSAVLDASDVLSASNASAPSAPSPHQVCA